MIAFDVLVWLLAVVTPAQDKPTPLGIPELATIARAYEESLRTIWFRCESTFPDASAKRSDPSFFGPEDIVREVYAQEADTEYYGSVTEMKGRSPSRSRYFRRGAELWAFFGEDGLDPAVDVSPSNLRQRPTVLSGMYDPMGNRLSMLLRSEATVIGRERVNGINCHLVKTPGSAVDVTWYLDPEHDFLCCRKEFVRPSGEAAGTWQVVSFARNGDRWFPEAATMTSPVRVKDRVVNFVSHHRIQELRVNEAIPDSLFQVPRIPEGARVRDTRGDTPKRYVQGGTGAFEKLIARKKAASRPAGHGKTLSIEPPTHWSVWAGLACAIVAVACLVYAVKIRLTG